MRSRARFTSRSGSITVEFALCCLTLIPVFLGTWAFGFTFFQYGKLESAVHAGARYASLQTYDSASATPAADFLTAVQKVTVYGDPGADPTTATPVVAGLTTANVQLAVTFTSGAPSAMTVSITNFQLTSYITTVSLTGKPSVSFPFLGYWGPP
jgi:Flp pilus assembly protein TadG